MPSHPLVRVAIAAATLACQAALAAEPAHQDEHAHHHQMLAAPSAQVSMRHYQVPSAKLRDELGRSVDLQALLAGDRPVIVNFIYTSCTTICPVMTATLLQLQRELAGSKTSPLYVSISVDPEFDSPAVLKNYAARFGADWKFLTGERNVVLGVLQNFDAWRGNKANHAAITLMRAGNSPHWTRVEGLASARELAAAWRGIEG